MTTTEIKEAPIEQVRRFIDDFAITADLTNPAHIDLLHAAKIRVTLANGWEYIRAQGWIN